MKLIHVLQEDQNIFADYDERTKKHLREMDALVNHNIFLSRFGKKIFYSNGFAAKFKTKKKILCIVNFIKFSAIAS